MRKPPQVLVTQIGARRHYAVPQALQLAGSLERLVTDACTNGWPWRWLDRALPSRLTPTGLRALLDRKAPLVPNKKIRTLPLFGLSAPWDHRSDERQTEFWARRNATFGRRVVQLGFANADTVYAFNAAGLEILKAARARGLHTVLDQTAAPWRWNRRLLEEEARRWPGWEEGEPEIDLTGSLADREEEEWRLADRIICGSDFAKRGVVETGGPADRCLVVPYGQVHGGTVRRRQSRSNYTTDPLRVLFVGTLQLRKGIQYLWQAKGLLAGEDLVVRVVGPSQLSHTAMDKLRQDLDVVGQVPRSQLAAHYKWADVFVLPTLSEGSANVVQEALAAGLPVVTTANSGASLRDGENALVVPVRDAQALAAALLRVMRGEWHPPSRPAFLAEMGEITEARLLSYGQRLVEAIGDSPEVARASEGVGSFVRPTTRHRTLGAS